MSWVTFKKGVKRKYLISPACEKSKEYLIETEEIQSSNLILDFLY